jgi:hypothetical protein
MYFIEVSHSILVNLFKESSSLISLKSLPIISSDILDCQIFFFSKNSGNYFTSFCISLTDWLFTHSLCLAKSTDIDKYYDNVLHS